MWYLRPGDGADSCLASHGDHGDQQAALGGDAKWALVATANDSGDCQGEAGSVSRRRGDGGGGLGGVNADGLVAFQSERLLGCCDLNAGRAARLDREQRWMKQFQ